MTAIGTMAVCLLVYGLVVATVAPSVLPAVGRGGVAPRLGIAAWLAALGSVLASWLLALALLMVELVGRWDRPGGTVGSCLAVLGRVLDGRYGLLARVALAALVGLVVVATVHLAVQLTRILRRGRRQAGHYWVLAQVVGRRVPGLDAVVVDAGEPAAYCVPGRPGTIVVTSAAVDQLDGDQLGAVLAHERAHLAGRHHLLLAITGALAGLLPNLALCRAGAAEVARLLEMSADDAAVRQHGRVPLLGALLAMTTRLPIPTAALGATGSAMTARADRLLHPVRPARRALFRLLLMLVLVVLIAGPMVVAVLPSVGVNPCRLPLG